MNKFKKYLTLALSVATFFAAGAGINAHAANWYAGTPSVLHGTWKAKKVTKSGYQSGDGETSITKNAIHETHRFAPMDPQDIKNIKYKYNGNENYTLSGTTLNSNLKKYKVKVHFKVYNKDKVYFSGLRSGQYGDTATYYRS